MKSKSNHYLFSTVLLALFISVTGCKESSRSAVPDESAATPAMTIEEPDNTILIETADIMKKARLVEQDSLNKILGLDENSRPYDYIEFNMAELNQYLLWVEQELGADFSKEKSKIRVYFAKELMSVNEDGSNVVLGKKNTVYFIPTQERGTKSEGSIFSLIPYQGTIKAYNRGSGGNDR